MPTETIVTCTKCGRPIEGEAFMHEGEPYCNECKESAFYRCAKCGNVHLMDGSEMIHDGDMYCNRCFWEKYTYCPGCDGIILREEATEVNGRYYCGDCSNRLFVRCDCCGGLTRRWATNSVNDGNGNAMNYCSFCSDFHSWRCSECGTRYAETVESHPVGRHTYCANCIEYVEYNDGNIENWRAPGGVQCYSYKPTANFCPSFDSGTVYYGFELEVESDGCDHTPWANKVNKALGYTYIKSDGSLDDGFEIVSHPATLEYHLSKKEVFKKIFEDLTDGDWRSHDPGTCGLHVHISIGAMEQRNPYAVHNLLILVDRFWSSLVRFSRRTAGQLERWARRYATARKDYSKIKDMAKREASRYMAVNLCNSNTVELRMFRGTLNVETFFATLQLVHVLVERAIDIGNDVNRVQQISWEELVHSDYPELNAYLERRELMNASADTVAPADVDSANSDSSFVIGDRVHFVCPRDSFYSSDLYNNSYESDGTIVGVRESDYDYVVEMDTPHYGLHDCAGRIDGDRGQYCHERDLTLISRAVSAEPEHGFHVGDRVRITDPYAECPTTDGTIVHIFDDDCAIAFDNFVGHDCSGLCPEENGWYVSMNCLTHAD